MRNGTPLLGGLLKLGNEFGNSIGCGNPWRSLGDSNPRFRRERATSWAARRREPKRSEIALNGRQRKRSAGAIFRSKLPENTAQGGALRSQSPCASTSRTSSGRSPRIERRSTCECCYGRQLSPPTSPNIRKFRNSFPEAAASRNWRLPHRQAFVTMSCEIPGCAVKKLYDQRLFFRSQVHWAPLICKRHS
jgi:hypothetical protein